MKDNPEVGRFAPVGSERDAIHIAIAPVMATETFQPGERVGINLDGEAIKSGRGMQAAVGVVDPFLERSVPKGVMFWLFMFPSSITSLRHDWSHPRFPKKLQVDNSAKQASIDWLTDWASEENMSYAQLMEGLDGYARTGEEYCIGDELNYSRFDAGRELWRHYGIVVGKEYNFDDVPFRCAC